MLDPVRLTEVIFEAGGRGGPSAWAHATPSGALTAPSGDREAVARSARAAWPEAMDDATERGMARAALRGTAWAAGGWRAAR